MNDFAKRLGLITLAAVLLVSGAWGQEIASYDFSDPEAVSGLNEASPGIAVDLNIGFGSFKNSSATNPAIYSGQLRLYQNDTKGGSIKIYANNGVTITQVVVHASGTTGPAAYTVDGGSPIDLVRGTTYTMLDLSATSVVEFYQKDASSSYRIYVDDFEVTYTLGASPTILVSTQNISDLSYILNMGPSAEQSFTVSGINLEDNISITPPTNYEISTGTGGAFSATNPITLTQSDGTVGETTIYVRLKAGLEVGSYDSETITVASSGADSKTVTCSGSVVLFTGTFYKITSLDELTDGDYVVLNSGDAFAMNNTNGGSYFAHTAVSPASGVLENPVPEIIWQIQTNGGGRTLYNAGSEKYVSYTGTSNASYAVDEVTSDNQRWTFSYASDVFTVANLSITERILQYNSSTPRFACYTSAQQKLLLYKLKESEPTTQASSLSFTDVGETGMTINWTSGNGSNRIVLVKAGSAVDSQPVDGTSYTASTTFGSGDEIGTGNYVVYNGTGSSVVITGLSAETTYHIAIAEFNGSGGTENYLIDPPLTGNQVTTSGSRPANPDVVMSGRTSTSITFSWTKNGNGDDVMLFYNTVDEIGTPVDGNSYSVSDAIPGGGTVLYNGGDQTSYTHSSLTPNTTYYYGIHSVDGSDNYSSGISGPCETLKAEPSNHVSDFIKSSYGSTYMTFTWSDNDGTYPADTFLVALETTADFAPADGSDATDGINPGEQLKYVDHGVQTVTFTGLNEDTEYTARIWPVSNTNRATTDWDYKTDGSVPQIIQTTRITPTVPFAENFDYPENDLLVNVDWSAHSGTGTNSVRVVSPGLEFSGYPGSGIGNAVVLDNTGEDVNLVFDAVASGTVYVSFLMKTSASNSAGYFLHLGQTTIGTTFFSKVWVNATGDGVGIGTSAPLEYIPITPGTPTLIVLKLNYDTKLSELFVFNSMPSSEPATADASITETATFTNVGSVALRQYDASQNIIVDGIRVATSWNDAPLPICLGSFSAEAANGKVNVSWVTESETENAAFRIYRDGEMIAELEGAGTTSEPQSYSYTDQYVIPGRTYSYVLADVDYQGKETKHPKVEVEVKAEGVDRNYTIGAAYPNPFNPLTVVPVNLAKEAVVTATLYDITGRPLRELQNGSLSAGSHALKIDGAALSTGIYFVHINVNNAVHVQKIALMK